MIDFKNIQYKILWLQQVWEKDTHRRFKINGREYTYDWVKTVQQHASQETPSPQWIDVMHAANDIWRMLNKHD